MSSKNLVICDPDTNYAARLAAFINGKKELAFQVKICGSPEQLQLMKEENKVDILLLDESLSDKNMLEPSSSKIIVLSGKSGQAEMMKQQHIFKYQSGQTIYTKILECCTADGMDDFVHLRKKERGKIIGVYSPVHRVGQTTFAIKKGKELAKDANVLYINLEMFAGLGGHFPKEKKKTLSVLLYYAKQEYGNLGLILTTLVQQMDGLDYIPPTQCTEDLRTVTKEEWLWLFQKILNNSIYEILILDLSECVQGLYDILKFCDELYMPVSGDRIAASKVYQFEETLRELGFGEVAERMIRCDIRRTITGKNSGKSGHVQRNRR